MKRDLKLEAQRAAREVEKARQRFVDALASFDLPFDVCLGLEAAAGSWAKAKAVAAIAALVHEKRSEVSHER